MTGAGGAEIVTGELGGSFSSELSLSEFFELCTSSSSDEIEGNRVRACAEVPSPGSLGGGLASGIGFWDVASCAADD